MCSSCKNRVSLFLFSAAILAVVPQLTAQSVKEIPIWERAVSREDSQELKARQEELTGHERDGRFAAGMAVARQIAEIQRKHLGDDHWQTADTLRRMAILENLSRRSAADRAVAVEFLQMLGAVAGLLERGDAREAATRARQAIETHDKRAGDDTLFEARHPWMLQARFLLASSWSRQGEFEKAANEFSKTLTRARDVLGPDHPLVFECLSGAGNALVKQRGDANLAQAEGLLQESLATRLRVCGPLAEETGLGHIHMGSWWYTQGFHAEAGQHYQSAVTILADAVGGEDVRTAVAYDQYGLNLAALGQPAKGVVFLERALAILQRNRAGSEDHAQALNNLAATLMNQGEFLRAHELYRQALAIYGKRDGENPPSVDTATATLNVADCLHALENAAAGLTLRSGLAMRASRLGKRNADTGLAHLQAAAYFSDQEEFDDANEHFKSAVSILREQLGDDHRDTLKAETQRAISLDLQGRHEQGRVALLRSLELGRQSNGDVHPDTIETRIALSRNHYYRGDYTEAERLLRTACEDFEQLRLLISTTGLGRAVETGAQSPAGMLAAVLARNGKPVDAWRHWEASLSRGLLDDLTTRSQRGFGDQEREEEKRLAMELRGLQNAIQTELAQSSDGGQRLRQLRQQRVEAGAALSAYRNKLAEVHGSVRSEVYELDRVRRLIPRDTALIGWLDVNDNRQVDSPVGEHWAVVVRRDAAPSWIQLAADNADWSLARRVADALRSRTDRSPETAKTLPIDDLRRQRFEPIAKHLAAFPEITRLVVLPSTSLRGVPIELIASEHFVVSYAPSATVYAWQRERDTSDSEPAEGLLAVGHPKFSRDPVRPRRGLRVNRVVPGSNAENAGLQVGDIVFTFGDKRVDTIAQLKAAKKAYAASDAPIPMEVQRDEQTLTLSMRPGNLGFVPSPVNLGVVTTEQPRNDRSSTFAELKMTKVEVQTIAGLFASLPAAQRSTVLLRSEASEQQLSKLQIDGKLSQYSYLHFATHGVPDTRQPMQSRIILARDDLPDPIQQLKKGEPVFLGALTAEHILQEWDLNADLVVLSACQSGIGRYVDGEGYLGFAQALLLAGARSLVLSLWEVDDTATSLLMVRFYENLLGVGGKPPQARAVALQEARSWLRRISAADRDVMIEAWKQNKPQLTVQPTGDGGDKSPYSHPSYWSAFILIGAP